MRKRVEKKMGLWLVVVAGCGLKREGIGVGKRIWYDNKKSQTARGPPKRRGDTLTEPCGS